MPYRGSRERNIVMCKCCAKLDETINDIQIKFYKMTYQKFRASVVEKIQ
jgi:hypothetical protein